MASASSSDAPAPVVGQRLSVYWTKPKEYFDGRIISVSQQLGSGKKKSNYSVEVLYARRHFKSSSTHGNIFLMLMRRLFFPFFQVR